MPEPLFAVQRQTLNEAQIRYTYRKLYASYTFIQPVIVVKIISGNIACEYLLFHIQALKK